jgi:hypothetical protein
MIAKRPSSDLHAACQCLFLDFTQRLIVRTPNFLSQALPGRGSSANAIKYLAAFSMRAIINVLWQHPYFDPYSCVPIDIMHQMETGMFKTMIELLYNYIDLYCDSSAAASSLRDRINKHLVALSKTTRGLQKFSKGLWPCTMKQAKDFRYLMNEIIPILHGKFGNSDVVNTFRRFADLHAMLRKLVFTEADLVSLRVAVEECAPIRITA